ncbi:MAG: class I SAM-dependent methyltransferase, partial [Chloroflexota bacterium]
AIASEPFVQEGGLYTGIDVSTTDIGFCQQHYTDPWFSFVHVDVHNAHFATEQSSTQVPWPIADSSQDMVTALSVWTHLNEADATYYMKEVHRVLKPAGRAIITFFHLDEVYTASIARRTNATGRYHKTNQAAWIFDQPAYGSANWLHRYDVKTPEQAMGVTEAGVQSLLHTSELSLREHHHGNWKEVPGLFFQDILVLEKSS